MQDECVRLLWVTALMDACPVGRQPQPAHSEQLGGGSRAAGSVNRLVHRKNGQVRDSVWSRARTAAAVIYNVTDCTEFSTKVTVVMFGVFCLCQQ